MIGSGDIVYKRNIVMIVTIVALIWGMFALPAEARERKKILYISSYAQDFETVPDQIAGIREVLDAKDIDLRMEFMDMRRFDTSENIALFYQVLQYKLNNQAPFDAVIVGDDAALQFAMDYRTDFFLNIPVFFLGINSMERATKAGDSGYFTGVVEAAPYAELIMLALRFQPKAKRVIGIVDNTLTGKGDQAQFFSVERQFPGIEFSVLNSGEYTYDEMRYLVSILGEETVLLYLTMFQDSTGSQKTIEESVELLNEAAKIPVYRLSIGGIGQGLLGGKMVSYKESGKIAAQMAVDLLSGKSLKDLPVRFTSPTQYVFDYKKLQEFGIPMDLVPADAILINKELTFYEENKNLINRFLVILVGLGLIFLILIRDNVKKKKMASSLKESLEKLGQAHDELAVTEEEIRSQYATIQERMDEIELLNQKFEMAIENTDSAVWQLSMDGKTLFLSRSISNLVEEAAEHICDPFELVERYVQEEDRNRVYQVFRDHRDGILEEIDLQCAICLTNGKKKWVRVKGKYIVDLKGNQKMIHGMMIDTTKNKEQEAHIAHLAFHDALTNLPNRRQYQQLLQTKIKRKEACAVLLLDVDNFKTINDTLGHSYGDLLLQEIASRLATLEQEHLFVSRFGGDEFLMLIHSDQPSFVDEIVRIVRTELSKPFQLQKQAIYVQFTIGISLYPKDGQGIDEMIMNADTALYRAKRTGKNKSLYYSDEMKLEVQEQAEIEAILRDAIVNDGFHLVYQPIVRAQNGKVEGYEALLRLTNFHIPPMKFVKVAEDTGLIIEIGRLVTRKAIAQLAQWKQDGLHKMISLNFSGVQLHDTGYIAYLEEQLASYNIDAKAIEIEITESVLFEKNEETFAFLTKLKEVGVSLSLDDFGTGYSTIHYLPSVPLDIIKLDKSLCDKFLLNGNSTMKNLIAFIHSLDMKVIAEGVERIDQFMQLQSCDCDYVQGYLFSRPYPAEELNIETERYQMGREPAAA